MRQNSLVILQARTSSTRLPAKVLLPINGIPIALLAAKRAGNTGRDLIVVTSCAESDDALADLFRLNKIKCVRGSLNNVLQRFVAAVADCESETIVCRLTADNIFPDGVLIDEMVEEFIYEKLDYLCCSGTESGLPYGVSAEIMRVKHLREALTLTDNEYDLEHVTPYIRRKYGVSYFEKYKSLNKGHCRCTVDCLDDYIYVQKILSGIDDVVNVSCHDLISRLGSVNHEPKHNKSKEKLVLGTAQLGMSYGIANQLGRPTEAVAMQIIKSAINRGVLLIDTARAYGKSEEIIGMVLQQGFAGRAKIITKLDPLSTCPKDATEQTVSAFVDASIFNSCAMLNQRSLDVVMLHRTSHLWEWNSLPWTRLLDLKLKGLIHELGASVQTQDELLYVLGNDDISNIQMPFNILDHRWHEIIPLIKSIKNKRRLTVHVRSALLQGLLISQDHTHWKMANLSQPEAIIDWLSDMKIKMKCNTITELCLRYVKSLDWIDGVVVGMESVEQLEMNLTVFERADFTFNEIKEIEAYRPKLHEASLNPTYWMK